MGQEDKYELDSDILSIAESRKKLIVFGSRADHIDYIQSITRELDIKNAAIRESSKYGLPPIYHIEQIIKQRGDI